MSITPGTRLGPYEIAALIGQGGMGEVYRATDTSLKRDVALKVLPESVAADSERLARFRREAEVLAALNHPNIAQVHGLEQSDTTTALVMELVDGEDLSEVIARGPIPVADALTMARQVAEGLEAAHELGIIHRDLKPANIKVRPDGTVKLLDFGLAKALEPTSAPGASSASVSMSPTITTPAMTQMGMILGTAAYMSPEQAKGRAADKRSDVWAFGAVLYEMLTGRRAFAGEDVSETLADVMRVEPDWSQLPAGLSPSLVTFLRRCLSKDPRSRVRDIGDVRLALDGAFETPVSQPVAPEGAQQFWRRTLPFAATAVLASLLGGLAAWALGPAPEPRAVTRFGYQLPANQGFRNTGRPIMALSPDGRSFVYNTSAGLYLRTMGVLEARLIAGTEEALSSPFFSPDGQSVGYFQDGQLKRVALSGGAPIVIGPAESPYGVSWETDGTILFGQSDGIWRVSANGGTPEVVIQAQEDEWVYGPELLPDGDSVLFSVAPAQQWDENADIVVQSLGTGDRTVIMRGGRDAHYVSTGHLVYAVEDVVVAVAFDVNRLATSGGPVSLVQGVGGAFSNAGRAFYVVSDSGTLVYASDGVDEEHRLVWVERTGRAEAIETVPSGHFMTPRLSSDGSRVLVSNDGDVWMYSLADGRSTRLTSNGQAQGYVALDPAGTRFAYTANNDDVWVGQVDESDEPQRVIDGRESGGLDLESWSPDGSMLAGHRHGSQGEDLYMIVLDDATTDLRPFRVDEFDTGGLVFSPDGRYVAYKSDESGQQEVYVRPFPGPGGQATVSVGGGREPVWGGNGELFYRSLAGDRLMAAAVETDPTLTLGAPTEVFAGRYFRSAAPMPQYDVTADGQRFLMMRSTADVENQTASSGPTIAVVLNWVEELKDRVPTN